MTTAVSALVSVVAVSLVALIGLAAIGVSHERVRRVARLAVAFAVGALLGDAFIHLLPEVFAGRAGGHAPLVPSLLVLVGMLVFFSVEKLLRLRRGAGEADEARAAGAIINLVGDAIHNFIDGVVIAASYLASPTLGVSTTLAVLVHELPQELGDFGVLIHGGFGLRRALWLNLATAGTAVIGCAVALMVGSVARETVIEALVPVTAGGFVYLATADLIPELQRERSLKALIVQAGLIIAGIAVMGLLTLLD